MFFLGFISSDEALGHGVSEQLKQATDGAQLALFASLEDALGVWSETLPPLILWDVDDAPASPEMVAFFASRLAQTRPAPLLLVLGEPPVAIESFGPTEVFTRPLRLGYLLTRLQFYQRMLQKAPDVAFSLGPWVFAPRARTLSPKDATEVVKLTDKEAALLEYLCAATTSVSRDELLASIWGYDTTIDTHTLETHIYRLRRKLMALTPDGPDVFLSEQSGYQINPQWREA